MNQKKVMSDIKNLVHIGFSKTGSSFLKYWYDAHPELHYSNKESLGGFEDTTGIYESTINNELNRIKYLVTSDTRMHCWRISNVNDADNWFGAKDTVEHQEQVSRIVKGLFGEAKILIVTRGFEGVLKSFYSSYVRRGGVKSMSGMLEAYFQDYILPAYDYDTIIRLYIEKFGKDNVIVLPFELLNEDVSLFLNEISMRLEIANNGFIPPIVNASFNINQLYWNRRVSALVKKIASLFGKVIYRKIVSSYVKLLSRNKLNFIVRLLNKITDKKESLEIPELYLNGFRQKAEIFNEYPIYKAYSNKYHL